MQFILSCFAASGSFRRHSSRLRRLCKSIKSKGGHRGRGGEDGGGLEGKDEAANARRSPYADLISLDHARKIQVRYSYAFEHK